MNASANGPLPNGGHGVFLDGTGTTLGGTTSGADNVIANNGLAGVRVNSGTGHAVLGNSIFGNAGLGIDVGPGVSPPNDAGDGDTGANNLQNFPVLTAVAGGVQGTLNSTPNSTFTIQFFGNTACDPSLNGEGQTFLGAVSVTTNASGNATIPLFTASAGQIVTATATSPTNDTSEFSACVTVPAGPGTFTVSNTNNAGAGSLRQAILDSNASAGQRDTIAFNIAGSGPHTIAPTSPLPTITDPVTIDGTTPAGICRHAARRAGRHQRRPRHQRALADGGRERDPRPRRSTASGRVECRAAPAARASSFRAPTTSSRRLSSGTDTTGTVARGNREDGLWIDRPGNRIGGITEAAPNVISGNGRYGILLSGTTPTSTVIEGNRIGTDVSGSASWATPRTASM